MSWCVRGILVLVSAAALACSFSPSDANAVPDESELTKTAPLPGPEADAAASGALRIVAGNLSSGRRQSYDSGEGARIFRALEPDVALVQEMNVGNNDAASLRAFVDTAFGSEYGYVRGGEGAIPNAIVSRHPILESGVWDDPLTTDREFTWARIDVPGSRDLWAVSVHLLMKNAASRNAEATALVDHVRSKVPAGDFVVIGGDFNSPSPELLALLAPVVSAKAPFPDDQAGRVGTNATRTKHLDFVLVSPALEALQRPTRVGSVERPHGLVFDTRLFGAAPVPPSRPTDSAAEGMQHMAVVKDFVVP